jgi:hypothetical protein
VRPIRRSWRRCSVHRRGCERETGRKAPSACSRVRAGCPRPGLVRAAGLNVAPRAAAAALEQPCRRRHLGVLYGRQHRPWTRRGGPGGAANVGIARVGVEEPAHRNGSLKSEATSGGKFTARSTNPALQLQMGLQVSTPNVDGAGSRCRVPRISAGSLDRALRLKPVPNAPDNGDARGPNLTRSSAANPLRRPVLPSTF